MSTVNIIASLIVLLAALVCYAFVSQTIQQKRAQRARVLTALKARSRTFKYILNRVPEGFLPRDLVLLVQRSLTEVCQQLSKLEPGEKAHSQDIQALNAQIQATRAQAPTTTVVALQDLQQIKDVKICLEELHKFIFHLESANSIQRNQADGHRNQIKQLLLQITVDAYILNGGTAQKAKKTKLAIHYYELALNLLIREGRGNQHQNRIAQLKELLDQLKTKLEEELQAASSEGKELGQQSKDKEWDKYGKKDELWKKKNFYD